MITQLESRLTVLAIMTTSISFWMFVTVTINVFKKCWDEDPISLFGLEEQVLGLTQRLFKYHFVGALIVQSHEGHPYDVCVCDTSLLSRYWTITSAHCIDIFYKYNKKYIVIKSDSHDWHMGQQHQINKCLVHSNYSQNSYEHNIAIIKVTEPFVGSRVSYAKLPNPNYVYKTNTTSIILSWGLETEDFANTQMLKKVKVLLLSPSYCSKIYPNMNVGENSRIMCVGSYIGNKGICLYEPGGPIVQNLMVVGINVWQAKCGSNGLPDVYIKLTYFYEDIQNIINERVSSERTNIAYINVEL